MAEEKKDDKIVIPDAKDKLTEAEANRFAALVALDRDKLKAKRAELLIQVANLDYAIAEREYALTDLNRRVVGVDYPQEEKKPEAEGK